MPTTNSRSRRARLTSAFAAASVVAVSGVALVPPATAAQQTLAVSCVSPTVDVTLAFGDTLLIEPTSCTTFSGGGPATFTYGPNGTGSTWTNTDATLNSGDKILVTPLGYTGVLFGVTLKKTSSTNTTVNITLLPPTSASEGPSSVVQQFGAPSSGTCDASAAKELDWAGVASGGWGLTWAEWMNDGKGGAVCSRTLVYSLNEAKWLVG